MDLVVIFSFVTSIVLIITGGVLLAPIARKLGAYLEAAAQERLAQLTGAPRTALSDPQAQQIVQALDRLERHVVALDERQQFTERMLESRAGEESGTGS